MSQFIFFFQDLNLRNIHVGDGKDREREIVGERKAVQEVLLADRNI